MLKILVVDDETPIREWIQFSIEREQNPEFQVVAAAQNGNEAYELVLLHKPDVIIMDIRMPGMDGITLMKKVLEKRPYTSVIILTNYAEFSYAKEAVAYGAKQYLLKSELRAADIVRELKLIAQKKAQFTSRDDQEHYSNGYLDIYECYHNAANPVFVRNFWNRHGLNRDYFAVAGLILDNPYDQGKRIAAAATAADIEYLNPILCRNHIFIVIQNAGTVALRAKVKAFTEAYQGEAPVLLVVSRFMDSRDAVMAAIGQAEQLLGAEFFGEKSVLYYEQVSMRPPLDRKTIRNRLRSVLADLTSVEEGTALTELENWFAALRGCSHNDIGWCREMCIKLVMELEEKKQILNPDYQEAAAATTKFDTLKACREACRNMIQDIYAGRKDGYSRTIRETLHYIREHYNEELSLHDAARYVYRSPEYLSRLFKAETGEKFSTYLMIYRLEKARDLLRNTDLRIYEIADAVGYTTPSYFSKLYRKYIGETPEETRSQGIKSQITSKMSK